MKTIRKLSAIFLSFCIVCSAIFVMTETGNQMVNAANDSTDNVVLQQGFEDVDSWVKVEKTFTATRGQIMIIYMKPTDYANLAGTKVYIDDIVVTETATDKEALNQTFEDTKDTSFYVTGNQILNNGFAPYSGIANDPRIAGLVTGEGIGHNGSNNAIQLGYENNPNDSTKTYLPILRVRGSKTYNGRDNGLALKLIAGTEYKISFYYKALNVNKSFGLYVAETDTGLTRYATAYNNASAINSNNIVNITTSTAGKDGDFYNSGNYHFGTAPLPSSNGNIPNDPRKVSLASGTGVGNNSNSALQLGYTANPDNTNNGGLPIVKVRNSKDYNSKNTYQAFRFEAGKTYNISFYYKAVGVNAPLGLYVSEYNESLSGYRAGFSTSTVAQKAQKISEISATPTGWVKVETIYTSASGHDMVLFMKPTDYTNLAGTTVYIDDVNVAIKDTAPPPVEDDDPVLSQGFEDGDAWVYAEKTITAVGDLMVLYMQPSAYTNLAGTTVYIDDVTVTETASNTKVLNQTFDTDTARDTTFYVSGAQIAANGIAPASGVKGDPRKTCLVTGEGVGHNGSSGAMQLGYASDPDSNTKLKLPSFRVRGSNTYNGRDTSLALKFKSNTEYKISFYYKAVGVKTSFDLYVTETVADLATGTNLGNSASGGYKNRQLLATVTSDTAGKNGAFYNSGNYHFGVAPVVSSNIPNDPRKVCLASGTGVGNNSNSALQLGYTANPDNTNNGGLPIVKVRNSKDYNSKNTYQAFRFEAGKTYNISFYYKAVGVNAPLGLYVSEYNESLSGYRAGFSTSTVAQKAQKISNISATTTGWVKVETIYTSANGHDMVLFIKPTDYTNLAGTIVYIDDVVVKIDKNVVVDNDNNVLLAAFEDADGKDSNFYSGDLGISSGVAPVDSSNIPNDPRLTCLVKGAGVGYNGSNGAMRLGYQNDPNTSNKNGLPIFRVRSSEIYNGRSDTQPFAFKAGEVYTLSFYYKAEGINNPVELLFSEYKESLSGYRANSSSTVGIRATKLADINESTNGWVKVEYTFTSNYGENLVIYLNPTVFANLAGTTVYIDDISVTLPTGLPKVNFDSKGGTVIGTRSVRPGYEFGYLPMPTRSGYIFDGWFNQDHTIAYAKDMICPDDIDGKTLYAKWSKLETQPKSFNTSFEESEYTTVPYYNDGTNQFMYNNITTSSSWFKEAELSYSGGAAMKIVNDPFYFIYNNNSNGFSLVNSDGSRFTVIKGQRYKIKFYYIATEPEGAHSYISAIVSSNIETQNVNNKQQIVLQKAVHSVSSDWYEIEATFEANVTGYVYITLSGRNSTSENNSRHHTVFVDNVSVDLLDDNYVKVSYYDGNTLKETSIGKKNDKIELPILDVKTGYECIGWFEDEACTKPVKEDVYPSEDMKYYAGYEMADYSGATASNLISKKLSFEENELLDAFYGTKQRITKNIEDIGREIQFVKNDPENARTGNNYIKLIEIDSHYKEIGFLLYDANNKNGNLYLEPGESYNISYWVLPNDSFRTIEFSIALADVSNTMFEVSKATKVDSKFFEPADYEIGEWVKITHTVTNTSDVLKSVAICTPKEGNNCFVDDISIDKMIDVEIKFDSNGGTDVEPLTIKTFSIIEVFFEPMRDGYEFVGWCVDKELTKLFDFDNTIITGPMTLYAKWKAEDSLFDENEESDEQISDFDELDNLEEEEIDNGERPNIMDADPIKSNLNSNDKIVIENSNLSTFAIVAIICGGVVLTAGLVLLILSLNKKRKNRVKGG